MFLLFRSTAQINGVDPVPLPCLAFNLNRGGYPSDEPVLYSLPKNQATPCAMDELAVAAKTTWATPQGWFLVRDRDTAATFLWSPAAGDEVHLPPLRESLSSECTCLLSDELRTADPSESDVVVLLLEKYGPVMWYCHVAGASGGGGGGGGGWVRHEYDIGSQFLNPEGTLSEKLVITPVAACRGTVYFSTGFEELGVVEFPRGGGAPAAPPAFSSVAVRDVVAGTAAVFMVESEGQVHMVNLLFEGSMSRVVYEVAVYRMDMAGPAWRRAGDLGGRAFLLSSLNFGASHAAEEASGLEPDCVYMAYPWDQSLLVYNVREGTMWTELLDGVPESRRALWMLPTD
ncbi:hypothetical protein ACP4OV_025883 [Aristida adscensionis]